MAVKQAGCGTHISTPFDYTCDDCILGDRHLEPEDDPNWVDPNPNEEPYNPGEVPF